MTGPLSSTSVAAPQIQGTRLLQAAMGHSRRGALVVHARRRLGRQDPWPDDPGYSWGPRVVEAPAHVGSDRTRSAHRAVDSVIARRQLAVASPVAAASLAAALWPALVRRRRPVLDTATLLRETYGTPQVALTDSGTSALVLALRIAAGDGGIVALPAYACVDLAAAARFARVRVCLYDVDPRTLGPDLQSLSAALDRGARTVVVAHLYGFPANVPAVREAGDAPRRDGHRRRGAGGRRESERTPVRHPRCAVRAELRVAERAPGRPRRRATGARRQAQCPLYPRARGVGQSAPRGGTTLPPPPRNGRSAGRRCTASQPPSRRFGWARWSYRPAHRPRPVSVAAAYALVARAFRAAPAEVAARQRNAAVLAIAADEGGDIEGVRTIPGAVSGMLRFPITDTGARVERLDLGILRGYPRTLREERELQGCLEPGGPDLSGADELRRTLFTLPTHSLVTRRDLEGNDRLAAGSNEGAHAVAQRGSRIAIREWHFVAAAGEAVVTRSEVTPSATLRPQVVGYRSPIAERSLRVVYLWDADYPWEYTHREGVRDAGQCRPQCSRRRAKPCLAFNA